MSVRLTCCGKCGLCKPGIKNTIERIKHEYPDDVRVVELPCMAACKQCPAVMIDYDFYPKVTPEEIYEHVSEKLSTEVPWYTEQGEVQYATG